MNANEHDKKTKSSIPLSSQYEEWQLLQRLENSSSQLPSQALRYKRKLALRRMKRNLGLKLFDIDNQLTQHWKHSRELSPLPKQTTVAPAANQHHIPHDKQVNASEVDRCKKMKSTPYSSSFARRLYGSTRPNSLTKDEPWLSSWNGRKLRPFLRRDFESHPPRMQLLQDIQRAAGRPGKLPPLGHDIPSVSIDYVYFQREHLEQSNAMLSRCFWDGIDVSESLLFPEYSVVALYKRCVIGCAFMTPEAYITFIAVLPGWESAGIAKFMLYHLFQTALHKDVTLHVSANNTAMILYQKFGFKPEEFIVNFYDKYLSPDSLYSKNAFLLRLRR